MASFLPEERRFTRVQELLKNRFLGGETSIGLIVYKREGGLTEGDKAKIARDAERVDDAIPSPSRRRSHSARMRRRVSCLRTGKPPTRS